MNKQQYNRTKLPVWLLGLIAFVVFCNAVAATGDKAQIKPNTTAKVRLVESYGKLPMSFEANRGQTDKKVQFISRGQGYSLFLTPTEAVLSLHKSGSTETKTGKSSGQALPVPAEKLPRKAVQSGRDKSATIRMKLIGGNPNPQIKGQDELPGKVNYLKGNDPKQWYTGAPTYAKVRYQEVYPGIDLIYYGQRRQLEYDFILQPGADPNRIRLDFAGADNAQLNATGDLLLHTPYGELRLQKPVIYQTVGERRQNVDGRFVLHDVPLGKDEDQIKEKSQQVGFQVAVYDATRPLVIDPEVVFSTYLGGEDADQGNSIAVDSNGNIYVAGVTWSANFPTENARYPDRLGSSDAFIIKLNSSSEIIYSTYLGGDTPCPPGNTLENLTCSSNDLQSGQDRITALAVDNNGSVVVTGVTRSANFPTVNAKYPNLLGGYDAFVFKLSSDGQTVNYSTYLGGSGEDQGNSIALDSNGNAYVTGGTSSADFPKVNAKYPNLLGGYDAFVFKLSSDGQTVNYSTYLGGSGEDQGNSIALDSNGNAYVTGETSSADFPKVNAKYPNLLGWYDAFVFKLSSGGHTVGYSSYLGGSGKDEGNSIAVDSNGNIYVAGVTWSVDFPTKNAKYPDLLGPSDAFITKLNSSSEIIYSTYLGGDTPCPTLGDNPTDIEELDNIRCRIIYRDEGQEIITALAVDSNGSIVVTGLTRSANFPIVHAKYPNHYNTASDAFVFKLSSNGQTVNYSTYLGGSGEDQGNSIALDSNGNAYVTGETSSADFPKVNAKYPNFWGTLDAFITKIKDLTPPSTATYGSSTLTSPSGSAAEPVNTATGNYYYQHIDLNMAGRGLAFAFARTYNAQDSYSGPLGRGWTHSYNLRLTENPDGSVTIKQGDGHEEFYDPDSNGGYASRYLGLYSRLVKNPDNSYKLTRKDRIYSFAANSKLIAIADRNGNTLNLSYDGAGDLTGLTDTAGRSVTLSIDANHRISTLTDPLGRQVQFTYDTDGQLISDTDALGGIQNYSYDASHRLTQITDRRGHVLVNNTYDTSNRVVSQANGRGYTTTFIYDTPNADDTTFTDTLGHANIHTHDTLRRLIAETDPLGHKIQYVYDANNNRTQIIDKNGQTTAFTYDTQGNVLSKTDAQGKVTALEYNTLNDPTRIVDALGQITAFAYDAKGNLNEVTDALGHKTKVTYDASGQPASVTDALGGVTLNTFNTQGNLTQVEDALGNKTTLTYDAIGRRTGMTDANGQVASFTFDNNGNLVSVTDPLGHATRFSYDANNNRTGVTDPRGNATNLVYDANDLLSKATDPLGNFVQFAYDAADNRIKVTDPRGNITQYAYDAANRLIQVTDALNHSTTLAYDANGNLLTQTNPLGHVSHFAYDELHRLLNATDALGNQGFRSYDALGRLTQAKDAQGRITQYAYDALGRLTKVTDAKSGTVIYDYDALGNRIAVTDPNSHKTGYSYDALNRLTAKTDPLGQAYSYAYDPVGNRLSLTDAKGQNLLYSYDGNNRLAAIAYPDTTQITFGYDAAGNRTQMIDTLGTSTYVFDALNRLDEYTDAFGKTVGNEYDKAGNRTALIYPDGKRVTYAYDALNRMASVTDWLNGVTGYSYDAAGKLAEVLNPNDTQVSYGYDAAERLVNLANAKADTSVLASYALTLDAVGNRSGIDRIEPLAPIFTNKTQALTFDNDNRLLTLDASAVTHDPNGNLTAEPGKSFQYDFEDRLVAATGNQTAQFDYDGVGNRLAATRNGQTTRYTLDVSGAMSNVLVENDGASNPTAYYVHGLSLISRITPNGDARYYHYDTIGSTIALTDNAGKVTDSYAYDPFGQILNAQGTVNNPFRYVGQFGVMQEGNGLQFMRARYYEAGMGRFLNKDPLNGNVMNNQSRNQFSYALNNPVKFVDVSGLSSSEGNVGSNSISSSKSYLLQEQTARQAGLKPSSWFSPCSIDASLSAFGACEGAFAEGLGKPIGELKIIQGIATYSGAFVGAMITAPVTVAATVGLVLTTTVTAPLQITSGALELTGNSDLASKLDSISNYTGWASLALDWRSAVNAVQAVKFLGPVNLLSRAPVETVKVLELANTTLPLIGRGLGSAYNQTTEYLGQKLYDWGLY